MKKSTLYYSLIFLFLTLLVNNNLRAQPGHGMGMQLGRGLAEELNLSQEQVERLRCGDPGMGRELRDAILNEKQKLNEMIRDRNIPDEEILGKLNIINELQAQFNKFRLEKILKARQVLSKDQLKKLMQIRRHQHMGE